MFSWFSLSVLMPRIGRDNFLHFRETSKKYFLKLSRKHFFSKFQQTQMMIMITTMELNEAKFSYNGFQTDARDEHNSQTQKTTSSDDDDDNNDYGTLYKTS